MKRIFTIVLVLLSMGTMAQQYNNEWIDFSKTYYKFKIVANGLYRIPQTTLNTAGLGAIPAEQFKLFRNGKEVSLYTSVATGVIPANGYIEFWGEGNDGKADKPLYRDPAFQHTDKVSLQTDTAVYFLTVNTGANRRFLAGTNDVASNTLAAESYFMYTAAKYFKEKMNPGFAAVIGEYVYSSSYDKGEFWSTTDIAPSAPRTDAQNSLNVFTGGPDAKLRYGAVGGALNTRTLKVAVNGTDVRESVMDYFNDTLTEASFPSSVINSGTANIRFTNTSLTATDRMVVSFYELTYPRKFNFGAAKNFEFSLPGKADGYYLTITNFSHGTQPVYLYDLTYQERTQAVVSATGDTLKFVLPGSTAERRFILVSHEAANIKTVAALTPKTFVNYNTTANQGDYLIVSSPLLYNGIGGVNPVDEYRKYRSSTGYNAKIYEIDDLVDQFAFGIKKHPLSVKNFIRFAKNKFAVTPKNVFLIGRGVAYNEYRTYQADPLADRLNIIPSFGFPASDNMLSAEDVSSPVVTIPIGRLSVVVPKEIEDYLEKAKEYEETQKNAPHTIDGRLWMKNAIHVTGASDAYLGTVLCNYMEAYKHILQDTLAGVQITVFCKSSTVEGEALSNDRIADLFEDGLSLVTYFGHSSATTLEFNLDNPQNYNSKGKYPVFSVNGCNAGNFFTFDAQRFTFNETLSEKFTLAKQRGGIAFIASTHYGIVNYLNIFINTLYANMGKDYYGKTLGEINKAALSTVVAVSGMGDYYARLHAEEVTLHGDPALVMNFQAKPDYVIEEPQVKISPAFISIAEDSFDVAIKPYNLGKAVDDSITVEIKRQYPDNSTPVVLMKKRIKAFYYSDSLSLRVPIVATRDKGTNKLIITFDSDNEIDEMSETNNTITKEFFIYEDEARPAFPYNYSIVNDAAQKLYTSTANPFSSLKQYAVEIDTTELFTSPGKVAKTVSSVGGVFEIDPGVAFKDSTVYYWRTSLIPGAGGEYRWNNSSFTFIKNSTPGFVQGHYFQHLKSSIDRMTLGADRTWKYGLRNNSLFIRNAIYPTAGSEDNEFSVSINGDTYIYSACVGYSLIFHVFDPITFKPWKNTDAARNNLYLYNSGPANCNFGRDYNFEWTYLNSTERKKMMDFMDVIPNGAYVVVRSISNIWQPDMGYVKDWKADTTLFGSNKSLYHKLYAAGFTALDSFYRLRSFVFVYKKGDATFAPKFKISEGIYDRVVMPADCPSPDTLGHIVSPKFGPAKGWKQMHWRGSSNETPFVDKPTIDIIGVDNANNESVLYTVDKTQQDFDISSINATQYPYIKLKMHNLDSVKLTPYQLRFWQLDYDPIPEGALAPNIFFTPTNKDTLDIGDKYSFGIAFKNIGQAAFDSIKVKFVITDKDNVPHTFDLPKRKPLISGDTAVLRYEIDTKDYPGLNTLYVDFNPDNHQLEQFHYNNFMFRNFYVRPDNINPLLDVTFDGMHILNRDIVSSKPHIQIKLKDEAKYLLLNDTSLITTLQVKFPDAAGTVRTYKFGTDTLRFTPAVSGTQNEATVDFMPYFPTLKDANGDPLNPDGDEYELIIKAKDKSGNKAGNIEYRVTFKIIDKPMISNLLNYPNPFTTSTAFVFTITGSEIPSNMKIQILTVTGKIVREITKDELGPLHIGRNITEFKWDGTDQYGQRLANGVYLYRVVTTLNGKQMEKYKAEGDETDKFFTRGYGKMYLMK